MRSFKRVVSSALICSLLLSMVPSFGLTAYASDDVVVPAKEDNKNYYPNGKYSYENRFNEVKQNTNDIQSIGRLPTYDEFCDDTDYVPHYGNMPLTQFRSVYGTGSDFDPPDSIDAIYITSFEELNLLSNLVNLTEQNETLDEQEYYSSAKYELADDIIASEYSEWVPIGNDEHPFNGEFDGTGRTISGLTMYDSSTDYYGVFGYVSNQGIIRRLGVKDTSIHLYTSVGADVGVICGRNYGQIIDSFVAGGYVEVSNATVGGISAENYGTIQNTYSDFTANVDNTDVAYSDPQPITPVNHGTVTNSYFIRMEHMDKANEKRSGNSRVEVASYYDYGGWGMVGDYHTVWQYRPYYEMATGAHNILSLEDIKEHHGVYEEDSFTTGKFLSEVNPDHYIGWDSAKLTIKDTSPYGMDRLQNGNTNYYVQRESLKHVYSDYTNDYIIPSETISSRPMTWDDISNNLGYTKTIYLYQYQTLELDEHGNLVDPDAVVMDFIQDPDNNYACIPIVYDLDEHGEYIPVYNADGSLRTKTVYYRQSTYRGYVHDDYTGYNGTPVWAEDLATTIDLGTSFSTGSYVYEMLSLSKNSDGWYSLNDVETMLNGSNAASRSETVSSGGILIAAENQMDLWDYPLEIPSYIELENQWSVWANDEGNLDNYTYWYTSPDVVDYASTSYLIYHTWQDLIHNCPPKHTAVYNQAYENVFSKYFPWLDAHPIDVSGLSDEERKAVVLAWVTQFEAFRDDLFDDLAAIYKSADYHPFSNNPTGSDPTGYDPEYMAEVRDKNAKALYEYYEDKGGIPIRLNFSYNSMYDWNTFADYVAGFDHTTGAAYTEYEQKLFASAHVSLIRKEYAGYGGGEYTYNYVNYNLSTNADDALRSIGTSDHPFEGTFDANNFTFYLISSDESDTDELGSPIHYQYGLEKMNPFFGVIGEHGCVKGFNVSAKYAQQYSSELYYFRSADNQDIYVPHTATLSSADTKSLICYENKGTIAYVNVNLPIALNTRWDVDNSITPDYYIFAQKNSGNIAGCNVVSDFCEFEVTKLDEAPIGSYGYGPYLISLNHGSDQTPLVKQNTGNVDIETDPNLESTFLDVEPVTYASERLEALPPLKKVMPGPDEHGAYHVSTAKDLAYFYKHGEGESVVLDSTIDMTGYNIVQTGWFNLDGTSTDQDDICYYIDLHTGTKCYGIINLNIVSTSMTSKSTTSNVYFIGGTATYITDTSDSELSKGIRVYDTWSSFASSYYGYSNNGQMYVIPLYGYTLTNVHSSADISYDNYRYGYSAPMGYDAELSSYSGNLYLGNTGSAIACVAVNAERCDSWGILNSNNYTSSLYVSGVAFHANKCTSHFDIGTFNQKSNSLNVFAIGDRCTNCAIIDDVDYLSKNSLPNYLSYYVFGRVLKDCRISADMAFSDRRYINSTLLVTRDTRWYDDGYSDYDHSHIIPAETISVDGFVVDDTAVISGSYLGVNNGRYVLFEGTANTDVQFTTKLIGDNVSYAINRGIWNVALRSNPGNNLFGMGTKVNYSEMRADINFTKQDGYSVYALSDFYVYGSGGNSYNYSDLTPSFELLYVNDVYVFTSAVTNNQRYDVYGVANFGQININSLSIGQMGVSKYGYDINNFADIVLNTGYVADFDVFVRGLDSDSYYYNYGNITLNLDSDRIGTRYDSYYNYVNDPIPVYSYFVQYLRIFSAFDSSVYPRVCNTGNINVNLINFSKPTVHGSDNAGLSVSIGSSRSSNYGDINVKGIESNGVSFEGSGFITVYGAGSGNYGNINVSDIKLLTASSGIDINGLNVARQSFEWYTVPDPNNSDATINLRRIRQLGDINVENCQTPARLRIYGAGSYSTNYNDLTYFIDNNINVKDVKTNNLTVTGGFGFYTDNEPTSDININTNIVIDNISNQNIPNASIKGITIAGASYRQGNANSTSNSKKYNADGSIELKNITTFGNNVDVLPFGYTCGTSFNSDISTNIHDCSFAGNLSVQNNIVEYDGTKCYSSSGRSFVNTGDILIKDVSVNALEVSGLEKNITSKGLKSLHVNTGDITIDNVDSVTCDVSGVANTITSDDENNAEIHNIGTINYTKDVSKNKRISISGIATNMNKFTGIASNGGKITVDIDDFNVASSDNAYMHVSGIADKSSDYAVNVINANDIEVSATNADNIDVSVSGLLTSGKLLGSAINYGDINATIDYADTASPVHISPLCPKLSDSYGCINYGDVDFTTNMQDTDKHFAYLLGSSDLAEYSINYGDFNFANVDSAMGQELQWIVDMSGNRNILPDKEWLYYAGHYDSRFKYNYWWKQFDWEDSAFNTDRSSLREADLPHIGISYITEFTYGSMFDSAFAFNYDNPLAVKYIKANVKKEYHEDNVLIDYGYPYVHGLTKEAIDTYAIEHDCTGDASFYGVYVVGGSQYSPTAKTVTGSASRNVTDLLSDNRLDVPVSYVKDNIACSTFNEYINALRQTAQDVGCDDKIFHGASIVSLDSYDTENGLSPISSKSSLIKFQAPIDGDKDREYSTDVLVTVVDMYIPVDGFDENSLPFTEGVDYRLTFDDQSFGSTFFALKKPIRFNTYEDCAKYLESSLARESNLFSTGRSLKPMFDQTDPSTATNNIVSLKLPDESGCSYIVGVNEAAYSLEENVIVLNLHPIDDTPAAWPVSFSYPVGISSDGTSLIQKSDTFTDLNVDNYKEATDDYTVNLLTVSNSNFVDYEYPEYCLNSDIVHTTNGKYRNSITNTGNISISFDTQNVDSYVVYVSESKLNCDSVTQFSSSKARPIFFHAEDMNYDLSESSDNGAYTVFKSGDLSLSDNSVYLLSNNTLSDKNTTVTHTNSFQVSSNTMNMFLNGGYKYITVGSVLQSGEFMPLFAIKLYKDVSDENYSRASGFARVDMFTDDLSSTQDININTIRPSYWDGIEYNEAIADVSILSKFSASGVRVDHRSMYDANDGKTHYPTDVTQSFLVTAESGRQQTYSKTKHLLQIEQAPLVSYTNASGYSSGMSASSTFDSRLFIMDENVNSLNLSANYGNVSFSDTVNNRSYKAKIDFVEVYINDKYAGRANHWSTENSNHTFTEGWTWTYDKGDASASFNFSINSSNTFYIQQDGAFDRTIFDGKVVTFKPVINMYEYGSSKYTIALEPVSFSAKLLDDSRLISAKWNKSLFVSTINTTYDVNGEAAILSHDVDINRWGVIDYSQTADSANHFYILDCVNHDVTNNTLTLKIPRYSTLERYDGSDWVFVDKDTSGSGKTVTNNFTYDTATLNSTGYTHLYRVKAQSWLSSAPEVNVTYYDFVVSTTIRNKSVNIVFAEDDATTMTAYRNILANDGNTAIQIKNMNADYCRLQQTKLYTDDTNMGSAFYKLTQGDFAIDVKVPAGYTYKVKIVGGSSEGYLVDHSYAIGKRLRLPYKNEQAITLKVYLEPIDTSDNWGVVQNRSLFKFTRTNFV